MPDPVILAAGRSPIGRIGGSLAPLSAGQLGTLTARAVLSNAGISADLIDEVIVGCVLQGGQGMNVARQVGIGAGVPVEKPALTVNQVCASGLTAIELAAQQIVLGNAKLVLAGGTESMSTAPHLLRGARSGIRFGATDLEDCILSDGLTDVFANNHMADTAEKLAAEFAIDRQAQDAYALQSQQRFARAADWPAEIVPIDVPKRGGRDRVATDECPRQTSAQQLAELRPAFCSEGTITAGNASGLSDGAAFVVVGSREIADQLGIAPLASLGPSVVVGVDPQRMGIAPAPAITALLQRTGLSIDDIDLLEINEAFAGQVLSVLSQLEINADKVNVNGGAVAMGHPLGATGCRILVSLVYELERRGGGRGIAALCVGGGMGRASLVEI